jgi:hypothetical protein
MHISLESVVFLNSTTDASNRTKNTILEYGDQGFKIVGFDPESQLFGATPAIRVCSMMNTFDNEAFKGWLPLLEIYDK